MLLGASLPVGDIGTGPAVLRDYAQAAEGLGFDYLEKYRKEVDAVTPADVQAMAKKHIDPKAITIVAVGAIDKDGKPLGKKK